MKALKLRIRASARGRGGEDVAVQGASHELGEVQAGVQRDDRRLRCVLASGEVEEGRDTEEGVRDPASEGRDLGHVQEVGGDRIVGGDEVEYEGVEIMSDYDGERIVRNNGMKSQAVNRRYSNYYNRKENNNKKWNENYNGNNKTNQQ